MPLCLFTIYDLFFTWRAPLFLLIPFSLSQGSSPLLPALPRLAPGLPFYHIPTLKPLQAPHCPPLGHPGVAGARREARPHFWYLRGQQAKPRSLLTRSRSRLLRVQSAARLLGCSGPLDPNFLGRGSGDDRREEGTGGGRADNAAGRRPPQSQRDATYLQQQQEQERVEAAALRAHGAPGGGRVGSGLAGLDRGSVWQNFRELRCLRLSTPLSWAVPQHQVSFEGPAPWHR